MSTVHRAVMIGHGVEIVHRVLLIVELIVAVLYEVRPKVEVRQGKIDGCVFLLQPAACLSEAVQMDDDYVGQLGDVELLHTLARYLAVRALPARDLLTAHVFLHAVLE